MSQVIKVSPSTADTSESNSSIDENNRYNTDSERGATTHIPKFLLLDRFACLVRHVRDIISVKIYFEFCSIFPIIHISV